MEYKAATPEQTGPLDVPDVGSADPIYNLQRETGAITSAPPFADTDTIGAALRSYYESIVTEPVPERFLELLRALEAGKK